MKSLRSTEIYDRRQAAKTDAKQKQQDRDLIQRACKKYGVVLPKTPDQELRILEKFLDDLRTLRAEFEATFDDAYELKKATWRISVEIENTIEAIARIRIAMIDPNQDAKLA